MVTHTLHTWKDIGTPISDTWISYSIKYHHFPGAEVEHHNYHCGQKNTSLMTWTVGHLLVIMVNRTPTWAGEWSLSETVHVSECKHSRTCMAVWDYLLCDYFPCWTPHCSWSDCVVHVLPFFLPYPSVENKWQRMSLSSIKKWVCIPSYASESYNQMVVALFSDLYTLTCSKHQPMNFSAHADIKDRNCICEIKGTCVDIDIR